MQYELYDFKGQRHRFSFSYSELRDEFYKIKDYTDQEFLEKVPEILHFSVLVSYFKELGREQTLSDVGILHELVHLLNNTESVHSNLADFREFWNFSMKL